MNDTLYDLTGNTQEWSHPAGDAVLERRIKELEAELAGMTAQKEGAGRALALAMEENTKKTALLKRLAWACWNADNREELTDEISGDLYSELLDYFPGPEDFNREER